MLSLVLQYLETQSMNKILIHTSYCTKLFPAWNKIDVKEVNKVTFRIRLAIFLQIFTQIFKSNYFIAARNRVDGLHIYIYIIIITN